MKSILIFAVLLSCSTYYAQTKEKTIDEVQILGRKKIKQERKEFAKHAQSTETLSEEEINRNNSALIDQTLGTMSGVQVDKRTSFGGQRVVVRGYGNDQKFNNWGTKFYLNGIPLTNADGVTVLEDLDFSLVNNIEVVKGPASTLYGGGVGGTVRFYIRPKEVKGTSISEKITLGSFNHFQSQTLLESKTDHSSLLLSYNHLQSDGFRPNGTSLKNNYSFLGNFKLNTKQNLSVYAAHNNSYEGVAGQISYADYYAGIDNGNTAYIRKGAGNQFVSTRGYITHAWNITPNFSNTTSVFYGHLSTKRIAAGAFEISQNPNYGFRSVFDFKKNAGKDFLLDTEFGAEYLASHSQISNYRFTGSITNPLEVQSMDKGSYFNYLNKNQSFFLKETIKYLPLQLHLILGVSANMMSYNREDLLALNGLVSNYNKNLSFDKKFKTVFTPQIALQKSWKNQIFNLSYSEGYNAPTASTAFVGGLNEVNDNLLPEKAKMWDFSVHGLLGNTKLDYQVSVFNIDITQKLTQIKEGTYTYWRNTGNQTNRGLELSLGYVYKGAELIKSIKPFLNYSYYDFKYNDFKTVLGGVFSDFSTNRVVGVPAHKYAIGLDIDTHFGLYLINTYNYLGDVYTDFNNTNLVKGFGLYNAKIGFQKSIGKWNFDGFIAGNNLTQQKNYTFLFLGNNINDSDVNSNYPGVKTDINPGYSKAYIFYGLHLKYNF